MKKRCIWAVAALCLALPAAGAAQGLPDFLTAVGTGAEQGLETGVSAVAQSMAEELELTLAAGDSRLEEGQTLTLTVTAVNPRATQTPVTLTLSLPERLNCAQETVWEAVLPAAQADEYGVLTPSVTTFEREVTLTPGGESEQVELVCEMSMGTRFYRARQTLNLCVADVSVTATMTGPEEGRVQPGETFTWRIDVTNDGTAARDVELNLSLPEGVTPEETDVLTALGSRLMGTVCAEAAVDGTPSSLVIELPLRVNEDALEGDEDAVRLLTGVLFADGERIPLPRVQVCGPKISARLIPDADELEAGEPMTLRVMVVNEGLVPADVELSCVLPEGLTIQKSEEAEATPAEGTSQDEDGDLPTQGVPALSTVEREGTVTVLEDQTVMLTAHMAGATEGDAGLTAATQVFELQVVAQEPQKNLKEKLVGASLAYSVDGGEMQLGEAVAMRVYKPSFLGISGEDWGGIFWATLLLLVTVACLYGAIHSEHDKEDYCCD